MNAVLSCEREVFDVELPDEQVVDLLSHDGPRSALAVTPGDHLERLPRRVVRVSPRTDLPSLEECRHGSEALFDGCRAVRGVQIVHVDIVRAEARQAFVARCENALAREPFGAAAVAHGACGSSSGADESHL